MVRRGGGHLSGCHRERQGVGSGVDLPVEAMTGLRAERRATRAGPGSGNGLLQSPRQRAT